jgi:MFS family permease
LIIFLFVISFYIQFNLKMFDSSLTLSAEHKTVILASSLGTLFEWYDFSLMSALAANIAQHFFSSLPPGEAFVMALFTFSAGVTLRPLGSIVFGHIGDKTGRKYSFLVTIIMMGVSTFLVGILPTYETIGALAPILLFLLRCVQGLAVGGEYGGAATYLAEHAPHGKRGFYTGFLQATGAAGFLVCILIVIILQTVLGMENFEVCDFFGIKLKHTQPSQT